MKKRIICIDDSELARKLCVLALERFSNFSVRAFESVDQALPEISRDKPDLLLLDYWIGEQEGSDALRQIRQACPSGNFPVVFVTALSDAARRQELQQAGALDVIFKPYTPGELVARVHEVLAPKIEANDFGGN